MDTTQMLYFITAVKCMNFTDAASQLYITQPTLSRNIVAIESELNVQLFIRDGKKLRLTPAGKTLNDRLTSIYGAYCDAIETVKKSSEGYDGTFRVGILEGHITSDFLPQLMRKMYDKYPKLDIKLSRGSFKNLSDGLYDGTYDVVITLLFDIIDKEKIAFKRLAQTTECFAMPSTHPKAGLARATFSDFKEDTLIVISPQESSAAVKGITEYCQREGFYPNMVFSSGVEASMLMVEAGVGVTLLNNHNTLRTNPNISMVPYGAIPKTDLVAAWHSENWSDILDTFVQEVLSLSK